MNHKKVDNRSSASSAAPRGAGLAEERAAPQRAPRLVGGCLGALISAFGREPVRAALFMRHAALSNDNPRASKRPQLVDRLGRQIERGRAFEGVPDSVQGPVDLRRADHEQGTAPTPIGERPDRRRDYPGVGR